MTVCICPLQAQASDLSSSAAPLSTAARNKQLASRMRSALADNRAAYSSLQKETALFRWSLLSPQSCVHLVLLHACVLRASPAHRVTNMNA